ncbi:MAG: diacylglycerol kinase family protein [Steroidobacteraceae bacterium]
MSGPPDWLVIVNPASGLSHARGRWSLYERALREAGVRIELNQTTAPHDGARIAGDAVRAGRRFLLAVGGDGSVNDVVNGLMEATPDGPSSVTLGVVPTGTGNDWARSLGLPRDPAGLARAVVALRTMWHDVGLVEGAGIEGCGGATPGRHWFVNVAGAGLDAQVSACVPRPVPSAVTYLRIALTELVRWRSPRFRVDADGELLDDALLLAFVANARYCGNRMLVAPRAKLDDGRLDVVAIRETGLLGALPKLVKLYRGTLAGDPLVWQRRAARVTIDAVPPARVQADGQMAGLTPATFTLRRRALQVLVPPEGLPDPGGEYEA